MTRLFAALALAALALAASATTAPPSIPQCPEDAVLVGTGEFENGRHAAYVCGPAVDDYDPEA